VNDRLKRELVDWAKTILWSVPVFFGLRVAVVEAYHVPTGSMLPTIEPGDRILGTKFHYWLWDPAAGDVVVFRSPERVRALSPGPDSERLVKRVVAVEGDVVEVKDGKLFVNGEPRSEPYVRERPRYRLGPVVVPADHVLVLGDNRNDSLDGHVWGFLDRDALLARAWVRYWPPWRVGAL
jgi:signal peptidase I